MNVTKINKTAQELINKYYGLNLGGKSVRCPYYMNLQRSKDLRAMVGKGTPEEIEMEARIWEKLKGVDFSQMSESEIREFLVNRGIGIDCSGFVAHVLNVLSQNALGKNLWKFLKPYNKSFLGRISYLLKPIEKLGADILTNEENAIKIEINDVRPTDLIRLKWKKKNSHHIVLITSVTKDENNNVCLIEYTHSIPFYGNESGIKTGQIRIIDINYPLEKQEWLEVDESGVNHVLEGYMIQLEDNGLRRLKAFIDLEDPSCLTQNYTK